MYQKWLDRIDNLLQIQRDRCLDLISANFTRRELIELKMMIETLMEKKEPDKDPYQTDMDEAWNQVKHELESGFYHTEREEIPSVTLAEKSCVDAISRQALLDAIDNERKSLLDMGMKDAEHIVVHHARRIIEDMPSVNPQEPKTGHWYYDEERGATGIYAICSNCDEEIYQTGDFKYCPNCGCQMFEPQERSDKE